MQKSYTDCAIHIVCIFGLTGEVFSQTLVACNYSQTMTAKILCLFFILAACNNPSQEKKETQSSWQEIQITTRTQKIFIDRYADSMTFEEDHDQSSFFNGVMRSDSNMVTKTNFPISKLERDSLYLYVFNLITTPTFTDKHATDYAGYVQVKLIDRNTTLTCEYKSVGEWSTVSPTTEKIYNLLKNKIPIAHQ